MRNTILTLAIAAATMTMTSCDNFGTAKSTVRDFMAENLKGGKPDNLKFSHADSTFLVSDSAAMAMRHGIEASGLYKAGTAYAPLPLPRKLIFVQASYLEADGKTTASQTFYLDETQTKIYCAKINPSVNSE